MQIVIDIDEESYEHIKAYANEEVLPIGWYSIINGTPLPKGHGRLKDVDWIDNNCDYCHADDDGSWCYTWEDIDNAPTIIEADNESEK